MKKRSSTKSSTPSGESWDTRGIPKLYKDNKLKLTSNERERNLRTRKGWLLALYILNTILEVLARSVRELKEIKETEIRKEDVKVLLLENDTIIYINDP